MRFSIVCAVLAMVFGLSACGFGSNSNSISPADSKNAAGLTSDTLLAEIAEAHESQSSVLTELVVNEAERDLTMKGSVVWGTTTADLALDISSSNSDNTDLIRMIMVGDDFYLQGKRGMPADKFVKFDLTEPMNGAARQGDFFRDQLSPLGFVSELASVKPQVSFLGDGDTIDGVATTKWLVQADNAELNSLSGAIRTGKNMEFTLWVGKDKLLRRMSTTVQDGTLNQTWREWGKHSQVRAPAPADVLDTSGLVN